ncbi:MAG: class I SAM-dependent methyltransferase [Bacillota bacterium]
MIFDRDKAEKYDSWYATKMGSFVDEVETKTAFDLYRPQPGEITLDAGCGTGNFSIKLAKYGCRITGIDISEDMLEIARRKAEAKRLQIAFLKQDVTDIGFEDNGFDGVVSMAAVEFIPNFRRAFKEIKRVVRPGGKILIGTITRDSTWGKLYQEQAKDENSVFHHAVLRNPVDFENIDPSNLIEIRECLFIPPNTPPDKISWKEEKRLAGKVRGGFFCALWRIDR